MSLKVLASKKNALSAEEKKVEKLEYEISYQIARRNELKDIDLHDAIIRTRLECRLYENLVYSAQRLKL